MGLEVARQDIGNIADLISSLVFHEILHRIRQIDCRLPKLYASDRPASSMSARLKSNHLRVFARPMIVADRQAFLQHLPAAGCNFSLPAAHHLYPGDEEPAV